MDSPSENDLRRSLGKRQEGREERSDGGASAKVGRDWVQLQSPRGQVDRALRTAEGVQDQERALLGSDALCFKPQAWPLGPYAASPATIDGEGEEIFHDRGARQTLRRLGF